MNNNTLPLVNFEQAKRLKEAGFDWRVHKYYRITDGRLDGNATQAYNANDYPGSASAPTVALSLKWLRDVKGFAMAVGDCHMAGNVFEVEYMFSITPHKGKRMNFDIPTHDTYEAAESALLDELLTLIENEN